MSPCSAAWHMRRSRGPPVGGRTGFEAGKEKAKTETVYLNTREPAAQLGLSARTLDRYRV